MPKQKILKVKSISSRAYRPVKTKVSRSILSKYININLGDNYNFTQRQFNEALPSLIKYAKKLCNLPIEVEDLLQETIYRVLQKQHLYYDKEGSVFNSWAISIMHSVFVNSVRRANRVKSGTETYTDYDNLYINQELDVYARDHFNTVIRELDKLPAAMSEVIKLISQGVAYDTAANILNLPVGTIRSRLSRGRIKLKKAVSIQETPNIS